MHTHYNRIANDLMNDATLTYTITSANYFSGEISAIRANYVNFRADLRGKEKRVLWELPCVYLWHYIMSVIFKSLGGGILVVYKTKITCNESHITGLFKTATENVLMEKPNNILSDWEFNPHSSSA